MSTPIYGHDVEGSGATLPRDLRRAADWIERNVRGVTVTVPVQEVADTTVLLGALAAALTSIRHTLGEILKRQGFVPVGEPTFSASSTGEIVPVPSGCIRPSHVDANMYGCQPCPRCKGYYRIPYTTASKIARAFAEGADAAAPLGVIHCDDCGFTEPITEVEK